MAGSYASALLRGIMKLVVEAKKEGICSLERHACIRPELSFQMGRYAPSVRHPGLGHAKRGLSYWLNLLSTIDTQIGHINIGELLSRHWLKDNQGDMMCSVLYGAVLNFHKLL